jgi:hypothetical protein
MVKHVIAMNIQNVFQLCVVVPHQQEMANGMHVEGAHDNICKIRGAFDCGTNGGT